MEVELKCMAPFRPPGSGPQEEAPPWHVWLMACHHIPAGTPRAH